MRRGYGWGQRGELRVVLVLVAGLWVLVACSSGDPGTRPAQPTAGSPSSQSTSSSEQPRELGNEIEFARNEVHERFGHPLEEIDLVLVEEVIWPNASLGCPQTSQTYDPSRVSGYRIVLRWETVEFHYHGADGSLPFHCMFLDG